MYVDACGHAYIHVVDAGKPLVSSSGMLFTSFGIGSLIGLELINQTGWPPRPWNHPASALPRLRLQVCVPMLGFRHRSWGEKSDPHFSKGSTLVNHNPDSQSEPLLFTAVAGMTPLQISALLLASLPSQSILFEDVLFQSAQEALRHFVIQDQRGSTQLACGDRVWRSIHQVIYHMGVEEHLPSLPTFSWQNAALYPHARKAGKCSF